MTIYNTKYGAKSGVGQLGLPAIFHPERRLFERALSESERLGVRLTGFDPWWVRRDSGPD